jgi:hypothetical protein
LLRNPEKANAEGIHHAMEIRRSGPCRGRGVFDLSC